MARKIAGDAKGVGAGRMSTCIKTLSKKLAIPYTSKLSFDRVRVFEHVFETAEHVASRASADRHAAGVEACKKPTVITYE